MKLHQATLLLGVVVLITSCMKGTTQFTEPTTTTPAPLHEYRVGLGYGFLGKEVQVTIDDSEVISIVGTEEIEQYAQLQGTYILAHGTSPKKDITVRVTIDGGQVHEQAIDLSNGMFVHIYLEKSGLRVFNTRFLVLE